MEDPALLEQLRAPFEHIESVVAGFMRGHSMMHIYEGCQQRRLMAAMVSSPQDLSANPQLNARGWFVELNDSGRGRTFRYPGVPWRFKGTAATLRRPAPLLGEHNEEIAGELGLDQALRSVLVGGKGSP